jgi:uncharacterized Zn finger protein
MSYLLFAWAPTGYELREQEGELPKVGDVVDVNGRRVSITKIGVSPLPGDSRPCAYSTG